MHLHILSTVQMDKCSLYGLFQKNICTSITKLFLYESES